LSFGACVRLLARSPVARNVLIAVTLSGVFTSPTSVFLAPYLIRRFGLGYGELGLIIAGTFMLGAVISTLASGMLVDWAGKRDVRWYMGVPAIGCFVCVPLYVAAYSQSNWVALVVLLGLGSVAGSAYLAPSFAVLHNFVPSAARAKTTAILQLLLNLIGLGLGPLLCGIAIDTVAGALFTSPGGSFSTLCPGGQAQEGANAALQAGCRAAVVSATQYVLTAFSLLALWPAFHFLVAALRLGRAKAHPSTV
jgi:MFS family permease